MSRKQIDNDISRICEECWIWLVINGETRDNLSKLRVEHPMLMLTELIQVQEKHEKEILACKGDALLICFIIT
jgi:hypothetical protein